MVAEGIKSVILNIVIWILQGLFHVVYPFASWGSKAIIVVCVVVFFCAKDNRAISLGIKTLFCYILFMMLNGWIVTL